MVKKIIGTLFILALGVVLVPGVLLAENEVTATTIAAPNPEVASIDAQIAALMAQIQALKDKRQALIQQKASTTKAVIAEKKEAVRQCVDLRSQLRQGMMNDEVKALQEALAADPDVYPNAQVTGFFGPLTKQAVIKFQQKHGLEGVGEVGPLTRVKLMAELMPKVKCNLNVKLPTPPGAKPPLAPTTTSVKEHPYMVKVCHKDPALPKGPHMTLEISVSALLAHIAHGDAAGACAGSTATTTPDDETDTAPVISAVATVNTTSTGTTVQWTTDQATNSKVEYGTTTAYGTTLTDAAYVTAHSIAVTGLTASTTYHFKVTSSNAQGNTTSSADATWTTL